MRLGGSLDSDGSSPGPEGGPEIEASVQSAIAQAKDEGTHADDLDEGVATAVNGADTGSSWRSSGDPRHRDRASSLVARRQWRLAADVRRRGPTSPRSAGSTPATASGFRGWTPGSSSDRGPRRAGWVWSRSGSGSTSGSAPWSGRMPRPRSPRRVSLGPRSSRSAPASPTPRRLMTSGRIVAEADARALRPGPRRLGRPEDGSTPWRRRRAGAGRDQRDRLVDQRGQGEPGPPCPGRGGVSEAPGPLRSRLADAQRRRGEPRRPQADLAALALLRRPRLLRPRARPLQARRRPREQDAQPRFRLFEPGRSVLTPGGPGLARRGCRLVQAGQEGEDRGRHRRLQRRPPRPRPHPDPHPGAGRFAIPPLPDRAVHAIDTIGWFGSRKVAADRIRQ